MEEWSVKQKGKLREKKETEKTNNNKRYRYRRK
jgi:hypothetical protein